MNRLVNWKAYATLGVSVKLRNDYADYDYLNKLNEKELRRLKGFHREFINADFKHPHTKVFKRKKHKKIIYDANNSRNRDLYNIAKWTNKLYIDPVIREYRSETCSVWYKWYTV